MTIKKRKNTLLSISLVLCASILGIIGAYMVYYDWYILGTHTAEIQFRVVEQRHVGFNLDREALIFGKIPRGGVATRPIVLFSEVPAVAHITVHSPLHLWVSPAMREVFVASNETKRVTMTLMVPENAAFANYTGVVSVQYKRQLPWP